MCKRRFRSKGVRSQVGEEQRFGLRVDAAAYEGALEIQAHVCFD